jgi:predicted GIY-YIG superfamily endonuclease
MSVRHQSQKLLQSRFDIVWQRLDDTGEQQLVTPDGHKFIALASRRKRTLEDQDPRFIAVKQRGQEFARIYPCCWGHTTNCHGTRIGGYSDGLDAWAKGLMISKESLTLKPNDEVVHMLGKLLNSEELDYEQACLHLPKEPGVYLVYDRKQKKYIYAGKALDIQKRIRQHAQHQNRLFGFSSQPIQKGLIDKKLCADSSEAQKYLSINCAVRYLVVPDEKQRKQPWKKRSLLEHYAICVIEPEYNFSGELEH